jgi:tetratricopeptide (TPR) repeat protein
MPSINSVLEGLKQYLLNELQKNIEAHKTLPEGHFRVAKPIPRDLMSEIKSLIAREKSVEEAMVAPNVKKFYEFEDGEFKQTGVILDARRAGRPMSHERQQAHALVQKALKLAESGSVKKAIRKLRKAREIDPEYGRATFHLARQLSISGKLFEAVDLYIDFLKHDFLDECGWCNLGGVLLALKLTETARDLFTLCLEMEPDDEIARQGLKICGK